MGSQNHLIETRGNITPPLDCNVLPRMTQINIVLHCVVATAPSHCRTFREIPKNYILELVSYNIVETNHTLFRGGHRRDMIISFMQPPCVQDPCNMFLRMIEFPVLTIII